MSYFHNCNVFSQIFMIFLLLIFALHTSASVDSGGSGKLNSTNIQWTNHLTKSPNGNDKTVVRKEITNLKAILDSSYENVDHGHFSYSIVVQKNMRGVRFYMEKFNFKGPNHYGAACFPSFFMLIKNGIATAPRCGNLTANEINIEATEGHVVELLIVRQTEYKNNNYASPTWRIAVTQVPEMNANLRLDLERQSCGTKRDDTVDEDARTTINEKLLLDNLWIHQRFYMPPMPKGTMTDTKNISEPANTFNKIVNGREANIWPWMVAIGIYRDGHFMIFCGGAIISRYHIVTANHCVEFSAHGVYLEEVVVAVRAHDLRLQYEPGREYIPVSKVNLHPEFFSIRWDMAVLELAAPLNFDAKCAPICLPWNTDIVLKGSPAVITGWGLTSSWGQKSPTLQEAAVRCISNDECTANWLSFGGPEAKDLIEPYMLCCGGKSATCNGDSGSPIHVKRSDGKWMLGGVVSFGPMGNCLDENHILSVFSRATSFIEWIYLCITNV